MTPVGDENAQSSKQEPQASKFNPEAKEKISGSVEMLTDKSKEQQEGNIDDAVKSAPTPKPITENDGD